MQYEARWVAISHYYRSALNQKMTKKEAQWLRITLSKEQYLAVIPHWCYGKCDGWESLVDRWLEKDEEQGNWSHWCYKEVQEKKLKKPLTDLKTWKMARERTNHNKGQGMYYGNTKENLTAYTASFRHFNPDSDVADPIEAQTDETAVVGIKPKYHGRHACLNAVITPSVSYTRLRATNPSPSGTTEPSQPTLASQNIAYSKYVMLKREELREYNSRVQANEEFNCRMMTGLFAAMRSQTTPPDMGAPPPPAGSMPHLQSFEEWLTQDSGTPCWFHSCFT